MKKSELKEMIKAAMLDETSIEETLVDADQDMVDAILNALGGEAAFEALVRAMSTDDAQTYLGTIMRDHDIEMGPVDDIPGFEGTMDALDSLSLREEEEAKKDEEEEEVEDVEVDAEEDITLDEPEEEEMDVEPKLDTSGLDAGEKELQNNLEKALEAAKEMGDEKLINQIGNTITFFTRTHVVGDVGSVEEVNLNEENIGLADLEEMGYEAGVKAFEMASNSMNFQNTPDFKSYKKGFFQGFTDESSAQGLAENLNEGYTRMQKLAGIIK